MQIEVNLELKSDFNSTRLLYQLRFQLQLKKSIFSFNTKNMKLFSKNLHLKPTYYQRSVKGLDKDKVILKDLSHMGDGG